MGAEQSHYQYAPYARGYSVRPAMGTNTHRESSIVTHGELYNRMRLLDTRPEAYPNSNHLFIAQNRPGIPDITPGAYSFDFGSEGAWALT